MPKYPPVEKPGTRNWQRKARDKIQAGVLIDLLHKNAKGEIPELSPSRVMSIKLLLGKVLPDLSQIEGLADEDREHISPEVVRQQVANVLKANPELLTEVLKADHAALTAVKSAIDKLSVTDQSLTPEAVH